jgi:OOP family OmpA-OmpF porin
MTLAGADLEKQAAIQATATQAELEKLAAVTDSRGTDAYNQRLSQRRTDAVRDYLVQRGYPADHIQSRGQGESSPIANNASAEGPTKIAP